MKKIPAAWGRFRDRHPSIAQFIVFFIISNGVTVLQLVLMPLLRGAFAGSVLTDTAFQVFRVGQTVEGAPHYIFNYAAGPIAGDGTGGGLAYFLAVQITIAIAQVINFFAQRNITFKANNSVAKSAIWYIIAYVAITFLAGAAQGLYKAPIYRSFIAWWGSAGETAADVITMIINSAISFWVFFPIFKVIFKRKPELAEAAAVDESSI